MLLRRSRLPSICGGIPQAPLSPSVSKTAGLASGADTGQPTARLLSHERKRRVGTSQGIVREPRRKPLTPSFSQGAPIFVPGCSLQTVCGHSTRVCILLVAARQEMRQSGRAAESQRAVGAIPLAAISALTGPRSRFIDATIPAVPSRPPRPPHRGIVGFLDILDLRGRYSCCGYLCHRVSRLRPDRVPPVVRSPLRPSTTAFLCRALRTDTA